jgi:segregation and condensation protein B
MMEQSDKRRVVEALILGAGEPISTQRIAEIIPYCKPKHVKGLVDELNTDYIKTGRAFEIVDVAGGYQMRTLPEFAPYLQQTLKTRALRLSQAALETLAVVAYRQPVTRAEIEHIRGVDVGAVIRSLVERKLVRIAGHRDVPGKPMLYGTTRRFLEVFDLSSLEELPTLRDLKELAPEGALEGTDAPDAPESVDADTAVSSASDAAVSSASDAAVSSASDAAAADDLAPTLEEAASDAPAAASDEAAAADAPRRKSAPVDPAPDEPARPFVVAAPVE